MRSLLNAHALWLAPLAGAMLSLAFAPTEIWVLALACPAVLSLLWLDAEPRRAALYGFLFTGATFLAGTYWLYHSIHVIGKAPLWLAAFLMLGLVAIMGGYSALLGYAQARWFTRSPALRLLLVLPAGWVLVEWFRGWFLSGFPWLALGYSQIDTALASLAPIVGVYGVSLGVAISAGAVALIAVADNRRLVPAAVAAGLLPWGLGWALSDSEWTGSVGRPIEVAIVQGAVPQELKWNDEQRDDTLALYQRLSEPVLGHDIVLWPEAALPALLHELDGFLGSFWREARSAGTDLVTGLLRYDFDRRVYYNGIVVFADRMQWYDKRRLVPFGEFFPVPDFVREWMRLMSLPYTDFAPGAPDQPALTAGGVTLGATICYEDAYGSEQLAVLERATVLVNVTNDAWFGDSTAPHQHLEISRMRALEAGRPLLRAANDGISALIDPQGHVVDRLPQFEPGVLTGRVQPRSGLTPYARTGNYPVVVLCALSLLGALWLPRVSRR